MIEKGKNGMKHHTSMRRLTALFLSVLMALGCMSVTAFAEDAETITIGVYSTTDMHGKCYSLNPTNGKDVKDSYLKVATAMAAEREEMDGVILVDNGDAIQGTPITRYNVNSENGVNNPIALCLRYCGYDAFVMGNHEFNFTMEAQENIYSTMEDPDGEVGGPVTVLCANYVNTDTQEVDATPYIIREFTVGEKTFKIGVLGFENVNVPNWDPSTHYEGHDFVHEDNDERTYAYEWTNYWQKVMREEEECDIVVVAVHSGEMTGLVGAGDEVVSTNGTGFEPENQAGHLIENTTGIDMVITGHNHTPGIYTFKNADGEDVPVVNGGTKNLTKTPITLSSDGTFEIGESEAIDLAELDNDAELEKLMKPYYDNGLAAVDEVVGTLGGEWDDVTDLFHVQSDTMDLVHKMQIWAADSDLSIAAPVAAADFCVGQLLGGEETAEVSLKDCYSIYRYDNNLLYKIKITGKQIKAWLERVTQDYTVEEDGTITGSGFGTDQIYGVDYDIYMGNPEGSRVVNLTYKGEPVTDDQEFTAAVNSYRISATEGADTYGWYEATGITATSDEVIWRAETDEKFGEVGGSVPYIMGEYFKSITEAGEQIVPGSESHWTLNAGASEDAEAPAETPAESETKTFTDVPEGKWYTEAVAYVVEAGLMSGVTEDTFAPKAELTGEELAAIAKAMDADATVDVEGAVTREALVKFLFNAAGIEAVTLEENLGPFADQDQISEDAVMVMNWAVGQGILTGRTENQLAPQEAVTRAECAVMLMRCAEVTGQ